MVITPLLKFFTCTLLPPDMPTGLLVLGVRIGETVLLVAFNCLVRILRAFQNPICHSSEKLKRNSDYRRKPLFHICP